MRTTLLSSVTALALAFAVGGASAQSANPASPSAGGSPAAKSSGGMSGASDMKAERPATERRGDASQSDTGGRKAESDSVTTPSAGTKKSTDAAPATDKAAPDAAKAPKTAAAPNEPANKAAAGAAKPDATTAARNGKADPSTATAADKADTKANPDARPTAATDRGKAAADKSATASTPPANLDPQKQDRVRTVLASQKVENITNVNFNVSVGSSIPRSYRFHPLPTEIVDIVPEYRGYDYIMVRDEIVIVEPRTRKIVYTFSEGRSSGMNRPSVDCK